MKETIDKISAMFDEAIEKRQCTANVADWIMEELEKKAEYPSIEELIHHLRERIFTKKEAEEIKLILDVGKLAKIMKTKDAICGAGMCPYVPCKDFPECKHGEEEVVIAQTGRATGAHRTIAEVGGSNPPHYNKKEVE